VLPRLHLGDTATLIEQWCGHENRWPAIENAGCKRGCVLHSCSGASTTDRRPDLAAPHRGFTSSARICSTATEALAVSRTCNGIGKLTAHLDLGR
jgi:hypothetical protein